MLAADFDFSLPPELIAQQPVPCRDQSRLLVLDRSSGNLTHASFLELPKFLRPGDLLILNNSRVIPARMRGLKPGTGGRIEFLLAEPVGLNDWWVLLRPAKRLHPGDQFELHTPTGSPSGVHAELIEKNSEGHCRLRFTGTPDILQAAEALGEIPLPPYIQRNEPATGPFDRERYQTIYARSAGSVAAPTAGLHFTPSLFEQLAQGGIQTAFVTLHVGLGTFAPVKVDRLEDHRMHRENFDVPQATVEAIEAARARGGRILAVGTTSTRVLETVASRNQGKIVAGSGSTDIFLHPPANFSIVQGLITNFHLPKSTLLMLISAFACPGGTSGREMILNTYAEAIAQKYRFFSYGDAMLII